MEAAWLATKRRQESANCELLEKELFADIRFLHTDKTFELS